MFPFLLRLNLSFFFFQLCTCLETVFAGLMLLYMDKVESSLNEKSTCQFNQKEEVFRCILTLHSLLENPPGDFPETLREDVVKGFIRIFSFIRYILNQIAFFCFWLLEDIYV